MNNNDKLFPLDSSTIYLENDASLDVAFLEANGLFRSKILTKYCV